MYALVRWFIVCYRYRFFGLAGETLQTSTTSLLRQRGKWLTFDYQVLLCEIFNASDSYNSFIDVFPVSSTALHFHITFPHHVQVSS